MRKKQEIICQYCGDNFLVVRSDAKRCPRCRMQWLKEWRKRPATVARKKKQYRELREKVITGYGGKCDCCGEDRYEFLSVDHVNGGGNKEHQILSTQQISTKIIKSGFPKEYRILCHNCNQSIGWYGFCPHNKEFKRTV